MPRRQTWGSQSNRCVTAVTGLTARHDRMLSTNIMLGIACTPICVRFMHLQSKLATLADLAERSSTTIGAVSMTRADVDTAVRCASPSNAETSAVLCDFLRHVTGKGGSAGCTLVLHAGCVPIVLASLRHWPAHAMAVKHACQVLFNLVTWGLPACKEAMLRVADCKVLLRSAHASGLAGSLAADVMVSLGFNHPDASGCAIM